MKCHNCGRDRKSTRSRYCRTCARKGMRIYRPRAKTAPNLACVKLLNWNIRKDAA